MLTDLVAALPRRSQPYFHPDPELPKHRVRVRPTGPSAYTTICRDPFGKQVWTKVGSTAEMMITEARETARVVIRRVAQGLPGVRSTEKPKGDSVAIVTAEWLKRHVDKNKLRSAPEYRRIVRQIYFAALGRARLRGNSAQRHRQAARPRRGQ